MQTCLAVRDKHPEGRYSSLSRLVFFSVFDVLAFRPFRPVFTLTRHLQGRQEG